MSLTPNQAPLPQKPKNILKQLANSDGTSKIDLFATGIGLGKGLEALQVVNTENASKSLNLFASDGSTEVCLAKIEIPALAGYDGTSAPINLMSSLVQVWINRIALLASLPGASTMIKLRASVDVGMSSGKTLDFFGDYWEYDASAT